MKKKDPVRGSWVRICLKKPSRLSEPMLVTVVHRPASGRIILDVMNPDSRVLHQGICSWVSMKGPASPELLSTWLDEHHNCHNLQWR